ncbi:hypothetical protein D9756_006853 [Leucocoprinus leucothites]|uniref:DUF6699 domain-containing protein n=1 Tax=Leucocoprinus leucothites TaxID=201217 RepID=A0A8H5G2I8_9AGAR|nr:hypothetical protein D9756_006853 [Leucoagaricus leucothites]
MQKRVHFAPTNTVFSPSRTPSPTLSDASSSGPSDSSSDIVSTPPPEVEYDSSSSHHHRNQNQHQHQHPQQHHQQHHYPQSPYPHSQEVVLHPAVSHYHPPQQPQIHYTPPQGFFQPQEAVIVPKAPEPGNNNNNAHMNIHLLLAFHPDTDIPLRYDLSTSLITSYVTSEDLSAAATEPPLPSLTIICPHLAWDIHVAPAPVPSASPYSPEGAEQRDYYVTVHDVLRCLHRALRQVVTPEEYDSLAPPGPTRDAVNAAYHARCARIEDVGKRMRDEKFGIRRIDFLHGMNVFRGLAGTLSGPHIWELNVAPASALPPTAMTMGPHAPMMAIAASTASVI